MMCAQNELNPQYTAQKNYQASVTAQSQALGKPTAEAPMYEKLLTWEPGGGWDCGHRNREHKVTWKMEGSIKPEDQLGISESSQDKAL